MSEVSRIVCASSSLSRCASCLRTKCANSAGLSVCRRLSYIATRFPAVRILGDVTKERCDLLREVDAIFIEELHKHNIYDEIWQAFTVLLPVKAVGVMGDDRTYENVIALRAVTSVDGMTADWARIDPDILASISNRIIRKVSGVNRVTYDISSKPPATIEWE